MYLLCDSYVVQKICNMNRYIKYLLLIVVVGLVAYKSVYIKKLSGIKVATGEKFDAVIFSKKLWTEKLPARISSAVDLATFIKAAQTNPANAFSKYSNALGIGNYRYALIKAEGVVTIINEDDITLQVKLDDSLMTVRLATEFIYGNAIRDASGLVDVKNFPNTMDLNNISEELNKMVRKNVLPSFKTAVKKGDKLIVTGAIEIHKEHIKWNELEIIPVQLQIIQ
jgi:predicted lipoprotein